MKFSLFRPIVFAAFIVAATAYISPATAQNKDKPGQIFVGETLVFDGKINKIIRGMSVAQLTFTVSNMPNSEDLLIKADAVSKGTLLKLFRYSFLQQYESTIDAANFRILKTEKHDVQKERIRNSETVFDYGEKRVKYTETDPKDPNRPPRRIASEIVEQTHDLVSAIYAVRLMPLAIGKRFELSISDSGLVFTVPVRVAARELQKTILGKVWCYRIEPEIFGKGKLIERKGSLVIWMTDDAHHTPVRALIDSEYGKIEVKLKSSTKAGKPVASVS